MNILFGAFKRIPQFKTPFFKSLTDKAFRNVIGSRPNSVKTHREEFLPFTINNLWDNPGARRVAKRIGRGIGSGKGKTSTKGHKGQNARAGGGVHPQFEGGQAPLQQRLPKFGVFRKNKDRPQYLNLSKLVTFVKSGRIDPAKPITIKVLYETGAVSNPKYGVKVLSRGIEELDIPLNLEVSDASKRTCDIVKKAGGSVTCIYRTKLKIQEHIRPELFPLPLADPLPPARKIKHLEAMEERGAKVVFKIPRWVKEEREKEAKEEKANKPKEPVPQYPVTIYPGMGRNVVRKRKPQIYKHIDYKL